MQSITIELSAEDRARLAHVAVALDRLAGLMEKQLTAKGSEVLFTPIANGALVDAPETPQEAPKADTEKSVEPEEKEAPAPETVEAVKAESTEPTITLEEIQQKVVQLAAGYGGAKKAKVRTIISRYGTKVSDLKEQPEKWAEVWEQLIDLEKEV